MSLRLIEGDCLRVLDSFEPRSIHLVVTDPPYFLEGLDTEWSKGRERKHPRSAVNLPGRMDFDPRQGKNLQSYMELFGRKLIRVLMPGSYALIFSQPRLVHRLAAGVEDAGFYIRDLYAWQFDAHQAQFKAFTLDHIVKRMGLGDERQREVLDSMRGRRTPQLRPHFESIVLAQKPCEGTFVNNWMKYETGLVDTSVSLDDKSPTALMRVRKPKDKYGNAHLTIKPVRLVEHLIRLFSVEGQVVLDPFLGSGTTAVAALRTNRDCIGIEINGEYMRIAEERIRTDVVETTPFDDLGG